MSHISAIPSAQKTKHLQHQHSEVADDFED